jgi:hypothetical protein
MPVQNDVHLHVNANSVVDVDVGVDVDDDVVLKVSGGKMITNGVSATRAAFSASMLKHLPPCKHEPLT